MVTSYLITILLYCVSSQCSVSHKYNIINNFCFSSKTPDQVFWTVVPDKVQFLQWSFQLPGDESTCAKWCLKHRVSRPFPTHYMYCMKANLPDTEFLVFNANNDKKLDWDNMKNNYLVNQNKAPKEIISYQEGCRGDSGSGQFVANGLDLRKDDYSIDDLKYVLVAIHTHTIGKEYFKRQQASRKSHMFPCGVYTWYMGEYIQASTTSESTTWKENLDWIKRKIIY